MINKNFPISLIEDEPSGAGFLPMITDGEEPIELKEEETKNLPMVALRNVVLFPDVILPVTIGRKKSLAAVRNAYKNKTFLSVFTQKDAKVE